MADHARRGLGARARGRGPVLCGPPPLARAGRSRRASSSSWRSIGPCCRRRVPSCWTSPNSGDEARPIRLGSTEAWVPSDRHLLLHLSVHFAWSDMFNGIGRTVRDVAAILAARPADWAAFSELAIRTRARTCAFWTLSIARTLTGTAVPDDVLDALRPRQPRFVSRALERAYVTSGLFGACPSIKVAKLLWRAGIQPVASGHGDSRPWQSNDLFRKVFRLDQTHGIGERLAGQIAAGARWWRFARALASHESDPVVAGTASGSTSPAIHRTAGLRVISTWARRDSNARPLAPEASALSN